MTKKKEPIKQPTKEARPRTAKAFLLSMQSKDATPEETKMMLHQYEGAKPYIESELKTFDPKKGDWRQFSLHIMRNADRHKGTDNIVPLPPDQLEERVNDQQEKGKRDFAETTERINRLRERHAERERLRESDRAEKSKRETGSVKPR